MTNPTPIPSSRQHVEPTCLIRGTVRCVRSGHPFTPEPSIRISALGRRSTTAGIMACTANTSINGVLATPEDSR